MRTHPRPPPGIAESQQDCSSVQDSKYSLLPIQNKALRSAVRGMKRLRPNVAPPGAPTVDGDRKH